LRAEAFVRAQTRLGAARLSPGVKLYLASELTPIWQATETILHTQNMPPPFWAFAWPGAEALAVHIAAAPAAWAGRSVLDFAAGCGLAGIAAAQAGAVVEAADIDFVGRAAIRLNAAENEVSLSVLEEDVVGGPCRWDVVMAGDVFYEAPMTRHILPWLRDCARRAEVIVADPGRAYVPVEGMTEIARYTVPTSRELEDDESRVVRVLRVQAR
jgi:predicted nicotinamide N-methyase